MSASEVEGWRAFYSIDPFGSWRDNYHAAVVASILAKANSKKGANIGVGDFFFVDPKTAKERAERAALASFEAYAARND